jgi:PAS domain S-box-containing protein
MRLRQARRRHGPAVGAAAAVASVWRSRGEARRLRAELERLEVSIAHARADALDAAARARRLQRAADALSVAVTPEGVLEAVLTEGVAAAEARAGLIARLSEDGETLEVLAERGYRAGLLTTWRTFPVDANYPLSVAVRTGEPVFIRSEQERLERFPALGSTGERTHALVCLPLTVEGRTIGGLVFSFDEDQEFDEERRALKVALARQAAQALERARLFDALRTAEARVSFLAEASALLSSSLDYEATMTRLATTSVPRLADWCAVDVLDEAGRITRLAVAHVDGSKVRWAWEVQRRFPPEPDEATGVANVLRTGRPEFLAEIPQALLDAAAAKRPGLRKVIDELGLRSWICMPLKARGDVVGALSLVMSDSGRLFTRADFDLASALADRAGAAIENALLYRDAERRGHASRALSHVADAVVLVDVEGFVRYWNRAAEAISGTAEPDALGRPALSVVPGWKTIAETIDAVDAASGEVAASSTIPVVVEGEERWLSVAAVDFGEGCVYAIRDVTREYAFEQARSEFVATASHELRTPLAAVYGAVRTLRRTDVDLDDPTKHAFLEMIENETERLASIVDQILVAGQLDSGALRLDETSCDLRAVADEVLAAAALRKPDSIELRLSAPDDLPPARGDETRIRQVLVNLVENAIKYSPEGGPVTVELSAQNGNVQVAVSDHGLGISPPDHARIFQKFVRLDPGLTRGVGGTGLGLYIAQELVRRMDGAITLASTPGRGSTFTVALPAGRRS